MLKVILNRLKPQAEELTDEKTGRVQGREKSTTEQVFNFRNLCEKYLQHQKKSVPCLYWFQ